MTITVTVTDMSCDGCEDIVEGAVADVPGVESVEADRSAEAVTFEGDAEVDEVLQAIDFAGYSPDEDSVREGDGQPADDTAAAPAATEDEDEDAEAAEADDPEEAESDDVEAEEADEPSETEEDAEDDE